MKAYYALAAVAVLALPAFAEEETATTDQPQKKEKTFNVERFVKKNDLNRDQAIDFNEFKQGDGGKFRTDDQKTVFDKMDTNKDGKITVGDKPSKPQRPAREKKSKDKDESDS